LGKQSPEELEQRKNAAAEFRKRYSADE